jgi:hypothetical protein
MVGLARNLEGKYKEAEAVHKKELATSEKLLERRHSSTPVSVYYLAYVLGQRGCYNESLAL